MQPMKARFLILLLALFCPLAFAHADVMFSGSVSTTGGTSCSESGSASSSVALACSSTGPAATATATGSGDAISGSLAFHGDVLAPSGSFPFGEATGSAQLALDETYVLLGGVGTTTLDVNLSSPTVFPGDSSILSCEFMFNGVSETCDMMGSPTFSEQVAYGVPFSIALEASIVGTAFNGQPSDGVIFYDVDPAGTLETVATPEPATVWLLLPALGGVLFVARRRRVG
jgi:hypothetical protein